MRYISRKQKENDKFCESVAKRFNLKAPLSFRASKIINANCSCAEDVKAWIAWDSVRKKCAGLGIFTISEIRDAFNVTVVFMHDGTPYERKVCDTSKCIDVNYREELQKYSQIFRKRINVSKLTDEIAETFRPKIRADKLHEMTEGQYPKYPV